MMVRRSPKQFRLVDTASLSSIAVRSTNAESYLLFVLVGFAASVILTRSFLEWTGYPQIASGDFHIAHVLWGGLLLFAAALMLLIWHGRAIYRLGSLLTGIGFGLFIDEVGKFITRENDYFYPLAAPLIYAFFLLTVLIYTRVRHWRTKEQPLNAFHIVHLLEQGLDAHLDAQEYLSIKANLQHAANCASPEVAHLARFSLGYLESNSAERAGTENLVRESWWIRLARAANSRFTPIRWRRILTVGFAWFAIRGVVSAIAAVLFIVAISDPVRWQQLSATSTPLSPGEPFGAPNLILVSVALVLEGVIGAFFLVAVGAMLTNRIARGLTLGYWGLLLSLTAARLLIFYFNQFDLILTTLLQFALLLGLIHYRARYRPS